MASNASFRAGGIHWAATLDAGGFIKGAVAVRSSATRLTAELRAIASNKSFSDLDKLNAKFRALENHDIRESETERHLQRVGEAVQRTVYDFAKYEASSTAIVAANTKQATSFKDLNNRLKAAFGKGSDFKEFLELMAGAGAIAGIGLLTNAIGRMGAAVRQASVDMATGAMNGQQYLDKLLRGIPLFGSAAGGIADTAAGLAHRSGHAGKAELRAMSERAAAANAEFFAMVQERQARDMLRRSGSGRGSIDRWFNDQQVRLRNISNADGIGPRQFANESAAIRTEYDRLIKGLDGNKLLANLGDVMQTKANTFKHWLGRMQEANEQFNARADKRMEESTARWKDRLTTIGNTIAHNLRRIQDKAEAFNKEQDRKRDVRRDFASGALGVYERLREDEAAPIRFASAMQFGSQEEFAARMQRQFSGIKAGKSEKQLMEEAVKLYREQLDEQQRTTDAILKVADKLGVVESLNN